MREKKTAVLLLAMFLLMLILGGCGAHGQSAEDAVQQETDAQSAEGEYVMLYLTGLIEETEEDANGAPVTSTMVAEIETEPATADAIADAYNRMVVETIYGQPMTINDVQQNGGTVKVDFDSKSVEALPIEEGTEGMVFYNLARSIDENLGDVDEIYFTMDGGKDFVLGHLWFESGRPFYSGRAPGDCEDLAAGEVPPED